MHVLVTCILSIANPMNENMYDPLLSNHKHLSLYFILTQIVGYIVQRDAKCP